MHAYSLLQNINRNGHNKPGLGFVGPISTVAAKVVQAKWAPSGGFVAKAAPTPAPIRTNGAGVRSIATSYPVVSRVTSGPKIAIPIDFLPPDMTRGTTFTREQLIEMQDRAKAEANELTARQSNEAGDGIAVKAEQQAAEENAINAAIRTGSDAAIKTTPAAKKELWPLILAGAMAYFLTG